MSTPALITLTPIPGASLLACRLGDRAMFAVGSSCDPALTAAALAARQRWEIAAAARLFPAR